MLRVFLLKKIVKYLIENRENKGVIKLSDISPETPKTYVIWNHKQLLLKTEISECGYKPKEGKYPIISKDNKLLDGHHRVYSLLEHYDSDYEITVYIIKHTYWKIFWLLLFVLILYNNDEDKMNKDIEKHSHLR